MSHLFHPLILREQTFKNRIFISPMCQYSAVDGVPNHWHLVHLGSFAVGGAGLVMVEATAVSPEGRISPCDTGLWNNTQAKAFQSIVAFMHEQGTKAAIQLAHAGRKASTDVGWRSSKLLLPHEGGWQTVAPSAIPFHSSYSTPKELTETEINDVIQNFVAAAQRSQEADFDVIELHMAHGYLLHQFLSPLSNQRTDRYGGSFENRTRFPRQLVHAVRRVWPAHKALFVRISATDYTAGGWDLEQSVELSRLFAKDGVDLVDCSSGGNVHDAKIPLSPGYQVPFSAEIRGTAGVKTGAVGLITEPEQAEEIVAQGKADVVFIGREALRSPRWPLHAASQLKAETVWPKQYERAKRSR